MLDVEQFRATAGFKPEPRIVENRRAAATIPEVLSVAYYEVGRDYQAGIQRARREGGSRREDRIDCRSAGGGCPTPRGCGTDWSGDRRFTGTRCGGCHA
ncbi:hypothetical protein [Sphingomonas paeninsulae]|uniref:hypothetical protein n=1 Tax=Sphingomonas paeninsulae TaxID=2319844 RepID=UPI003D3261F7